eukprot:9211750-Pyramimonas_sp.AAC.1
MKATTRFSLTPSTRKKKPTPSSRPVSVDFRKPASRSTSTGQGGVSSTTTAVLGAMVVRDPA